MNIKRSIKKHRRLAGGVSLLLCVAAIFLIVCSPLAVRASATTRKLPVYCVQRDDKCVSLTFDAAWGDVILRYGQARPPRWAHVRCGGFFAEETVIPARRYSRLFSSFSNSLLSKFYSI